MIYFDHAATSLPKSKIALEAFFNAANNYANASRGSYEPSLNASRLIYQTREDIKQYFHLQNGEVVFTVIQLEGKKKMKTIDFINGYHDELIGKILK